MARQKDLNSTIGDSYMCICTGKRIFSMRGNCTHLRPYTEASPQEDCTRRFT
jgi:hypothetical protein